MDRDGLISFIGRSALVATTDGARSCAQMSFESQVFDPLRRAGTQSNQGTLGAAGAPTKQRVNDSAEKPHDRHSNTVVRGNAFADEVELVAQARNRNRQAYQTLVERYQGRLLAAAIDIVHSRADAEDIVQNAFVKAYLSLAAFEGKSSFFTWLYRIVHNLAIDERRRRARQGGDSVELESLVGNELANRITVDGPYDRVLQQQQAKAISKVLAMISADHRSVILLREVDGLSYDEIAQAMNISRGTVMSRLHYARKRLQQLLKEYAPSEVQHGSAAHAEEAQDLNSHSKSGESYEHSRKQRA